jgi:lipopolysaccharide transport system permease protein
MKALLHPSPYVTAGASLFSVLIRQRTLVREMVKRDVFEQHAGQIFGGVWAIAHPLSLMAIYIFIFGVVFQSRIGGTRELPLDYTTYILAGLIPWLTLQQALIKACGAVVSNANLVKQVVFPIEILPTKAILATLMFQFVSIVILLVYVLFNYGSVFPSYALLPFLVLAQLIGTVGIGLILSSLTVFFRDLRELVQIFCVAGLFLLPIVYLPDWVPPIFKPVIYVNPFSYMVWCYQDALYFGRFEHPWAWPVFGLGSLICFAAGARAFRQLKHMFGNAL